MANNNYIKHQGPRKNSKFHQGVVDPKNVESTLILVKMNQLYTVLDLNINLFNSVKIVLLFPNGQVKYLKFHITHI